MICFFLFFFFSSRRRHTRSLCDWSSDVCSSDLCDISGRTGSLQKISHCRCSFEWRMVSKTTRSQERPSGSTLKHTTLRRSEERRVGKECRYRGREYQEKEKV